MQKSKIDILVSSMISSNEKNYKYSISYKDDNNYKIKPPHIMLPKKSAYVKTYDGKTIWMIFFFKRWWVVEKIQWYLK